MKCAPGVAIHIFKAKGINTKSLYKTKYKGNIQIYSLVYTIENNFHLKVYDYFWLSIILLSLMAI